MTTTYTTTYTYGHQPDYTRTLQGELAPIKNMWYFRIYNKPTDSFHASCWHSPGHVYWRNLKKAKEAKRRRLEAICTATSAGTFAVQARKSSDS